MDASHLGNFVARCTFIDASCDVVMRNHLWNHLVDLSSTDKPWVVMGDFNIIRDCTEKLGGRLPSLGPINDINNCIQDAGLIECEISGSQYTWCNNFPGRARIWCKLVRVLMNVHWTDKISSTFQTWQEMNLISLHCLSKWLKIGRRGLVLSGFSMFGLLKIFSYCGK